MQTPTVKPANLALAVLASFVLTFAVLNSSAAVQAQAATNTPPGFASDTTDRYVPENSPAGTRVGEPVAAEDADNDTLTYSISGPDASLFGIGSASGQITVGARAVLDYESRNSYAVTVTASDTSGASDSIAVAITVTDVDLGPLGSRYDSDKNEVITRNEVIAAIVDYFNNSITRDEVIEVVKLYFSSTPAPAPTVELVVDAEAALAGYWSDGTANVELTASMRNEGDLAFEDAQRISVTCLQSGVSVPGCGSDFSISLSDGYGPASYTLTLRVPMGEVSFELDYGGDGPTTLEIDVPERILGVDRDVWACFSDTSFVGTVWRWQRGVGCAGWFSETVRKWDQTVPVKVWAGGRDSFIEVFKDVLDDLSMILGLEFEWVPSESEAELVAELGHDSCSPGLLGCASSSANELGEVKSGWMGVINLSNPESEFEDLTPWAKRQTIYAMIHEAIHALGSIHHRAEPDSVMSILLFSRTQLSPMDERLLQLQAHPLIEPGLHMDEIEQLVVFNDQLLDPQADVNLDKWKLVSNAYKVLRETRSTEFRVRSSLPDCNISYGWADYEISDLAREYRYRHSGWITIDDGSNHFYYISYPVDGVPEYWLQSNGVWTEVSHSRYSTATSGWRDDLTDAHYMLENILTYADWQDAIVAVDPDGSIGLSFELDTLEHGRLDVVVSIDNATYEISVYSMDWELRDEACGNYIVEAEGGQYHDVFEIPNAVRNDSSIFDICDVHPLGTVSGTMALHSTWTKYCGNDSRMEGYGRSYEFSVDDWSNVRIEFTSTDNSSLHMSMGESDSDLTVNQDVKVTSSTLYRLIWDHWAQGIVPPGTYSVEVVTHDRVLPGTFGLSISTSRTHEPPHSFESVSTGYRHACALDSDGTAVCWGSNGELYAWPPYGEISILAPSGETFTQVSSGAFYSCGLKPDGSPVCWGRNHIGQSSPPEDETFVSISSGGSHTCALRSDGTPVCWGSDYYGESLPPEGEKFVSISSGGDHTCALRSDGTPVCWGGYPYSVSSPSVPPLGEKLASISSGGRGHNCGLRPDGIPVCWGFDYYGQASPPEGEKFVSISSGGYHTCALRTDGTAACWGDGRRGQTSPPEAERFTSISSGEVNTCAIRLDGSPVCWGHNSDGQSQPPTLGNDPINDDPGTQTMTPTTFVSVTSGKFHTCALRSDAVALCWGRGFGIGQISPPRGEQFASISSGGFHTCGVRNDDSIVCWGSDSRNQLSNLHGSAKSISSGGFHNCIHRHSLIVECRGARSFGQASPPAGRFVSVSSGGFHTCAIRQDGAAVCWGHDGYGQLSAPTGDRFASISSGWRHTCALRHDGAPVCWGADDDAIDFGQASPPPGERFSTISSGVWHTCALRSDGTPVCWGWDRHGQASPPPGQRFTAISSGMQHTCGITLNGALVCWGSDEFGQISPTSTRAAHQRIHVPQIPAAGQYPFTDYVDRILEAKDADPSAETSDHEAQTDPLVCALYGLTEEEIAAVEGQVR